MNTYERQLELADETFLTVRALTLDELSEHSALFLQAIGALNALLTGGASPLTGERLPLLIALSLSDRADVERIRACDLPDVLEAIFTVNGMRELTKQVLALKLRLHQAQGEALRAFDARAEDLR